MFSKDMTIDEFYSCVHPAVKKTKNTCLLEEQIRDIQFPKNPYAQKMMVSLCAPLVTKYRMDRRFVDTSLKTFWQEARDGIFIHEMEYRELYDQLADDKSRRTLISMLQYRLTEDIKTYHREGDFAFKQYFDKKIVSLNNQEVFVNCGGYRGDVTEMFINSVGDFSRTYFYEPDPKNYAIAVDYFSSWQKDVLDKIVFRNCCIGKENGTACFNVSEAEDSHISATGSTTIQMVSLDEDILEPVSFIKMDIEGFERDALEGAKNHITSEHPKLAICVYHKPNDLWEIPKLIKEYDDEYALYLRQYSPYPWWPCETVIYAV